MGIPGRIQGVPAHPPGTNKRPTFLFTPSLWPEGVTSTTPVYPSSPSLPSHPHTAPILGMPPTWQRKLPPRLAGLKQQHLVSLRTIPSGGGVDPDERDARAVSALNPQRRKASGQRSGCAKCVHKCVRACVSVSAGRQARVVAKRSMCAQVPAGRVSHQPVSDSCA